MSGGGGRTGITRSRRCSPSSMRGDVLAARSAAQDRADRNRRVRLCARLIRSTISSPGRSTRLPRADGLAITLEKNLPVAAGLGGGSADVGAVFRLVERMHGLPSDWRQRAAHAGGRRPGLRRKRHLHRARHRDRAGSGRGRPRRIPRCCWSIRACRSRPGRCSRRGTEWIAARCRKAHRARSRSKGATTSKPPAISLCPSIAEVLEALEATDPLLARMSGSGATCFALFDDPAGLRIASDQLAQDHPGWWRMEGKLR